MKKLFVSNGTASSRGSPGDPCLEYQGHKPDVVICVKTHDGPEYFIESAKADAAIRKTGAGQVTLIPVVD